MVRTAGGVTTVYFQGLWEQIVGGASKRYYTFNGQVVAMRDSATNAVTYLHGDHLGSVSLATNTSGAKVSQQDFDPWGKVRGANTIAQTSLNYTGQRLDGTGLLYYHARYYNPSLARFLSADSIIPGQSDTVGAANPQNLNRYTYVNNNPIRYTDPTGHCPICVAALPWVVVAAEALFDAAVVVIGGYLVYDGVNNLATITAPDTASAPGTADSAPVLSGDAKSDPIPPVVGTSNPPDAKSAESGMVYEAKKEGVQKTRSPYPPALRKTYKTKKAAYEAAKKAGQGAEPVHDPYDKHGPHYHPGDGNGDRLNHDHYKYPKGRGPKGAR